MRLVYVAGPFRAPTPWGVQQNVRTAESWALEVWRMGGAALCPHKNTEHFDKELPDKVFLEGTQALLVVCQAVLMIPFWERSEGSRGELALALEEGIPVFWVQTPADLGSVKKFAGGLPELRRLLSKA